MTEATLPNLIPCSINEKMLHFIDLSQFGLGGNSSSPRIYNILAESLLSNGVTAQSVSEIVSRKNISDAEITFQPKRLIMQDYAGLPALLDLAALRSNAVDLGLDPATINPTLPVVLAIDHSIVVTNHNTPNSRHENESKEFSKNKERFQFLKWAQSAFPAVQVIPPGKGILHQINLEYLSTGVISLQKNDYQLLCADNLLGTDSHSTMVGGIGVLGWGIGGIEATACLLGYGVSLRWPRVAGVRLSNMKRANVLASDIALYLAKRLRAFGVIDHAVEFFGSGVHSLTVSDRATISNMAPEYGATVAWFPIDTKTLDYFKLTGRDEDHLALVEAHARHQGLWQESGDFEPDYQTVIDIDLSEISTTFAGPNRPEQALTPAQVPILFEEVSKRPPAGGALQDGDVVLAAITSCTNTANPAAMITAGLVAKRAIELGLTIPKTIKTSFSPGSQVVQRYLQSSGLLYYIESLGFFITGYGCMTCVGNSGPLEPSVQEMISGGEFDVCAVISGNRNFEGRIHKSIRSCFLMSPPFVILSALAGHMRLDLEKDVITTAPDGTPIQLIDLWPSSDAVSEILERHVKQDDFHDVYRLIDEGSKEWKELYSPCGSTFEWDDSSLYIRRPPIVAPETSQINVINARVLLKLGDSITTDHISPVGAIDPESTAGRYLRDLGLHLDDLNTYGARRGNHEVMLRGTFANPRLANQFLPDRHGGWAIGPDGETAYEVYTAAEKYTRAKIPTVICAGHSYGTGSARDWAAKGTAGLGVKAVIARSFERIHRTNLILCGVLPVTLPPELEWDALTLSAIDEISLVPEGSLKPDGQIRMTIHRPCGASDQYMTKCAIRTVKELSLYLNGGVLAACHMHMLERAEAKLQLSEHNDVI
ncbi:aconitate hydratase AcnA [Thalassospira povalilytica]|uniref:aconitate hydratase AcnA n=1 Tax=Thalassospira povalilytica TaxID=732237 RepID=UPI001D196049|nr:aconitate hydratase AcnA [Thalassospira povalilytica]MCC4242084.1 aconitate hydratase AcnA [Thalassospira povalilytica]